MVISWDENQLPALSSWIEEKMPLSHGEVLVATMDIPPNCFAGQVDLPEKEFTVYLNLEAPLSDATINVFLGYIVALAYDKSEWSGMPTYDVLFDCHRLVCQSLLDFNEDFSKALEEHAAILDAWHKTHASAAAEDTTLLETMGTSMFVVNPSDNKNYGVN